jgi:hypothetical protein
MKYQQKSFSVPCCEQGVSQADWEAIFGSEEERKAKLAKAIEDQKARPKAPITRKCRGGIGAGKVQG